MATRKKATSKPAAQPVVEKANKLATTVQVWYGPNQPLLELELARWVELFRSKHPGAQVVRLTYDKSAEGSQAEAIHQATAGGLFSRKQLLIFSGFFACDAKGELGGAVLDVAQNPPEGTVVVLREGAKVTWSRGLARECKKLGEAKELTPREFLNLSDLELERWVVVRAQAEGASLGTGVARRLAQATAGDVLRLSQELAKLTAYANGREVTVHDLDLLVSGQPEDDVFAFTDAVGRRDFATAQATLLRQFDQGVSPQSLVGLLAWHLRTLAGVRNAVDRKGSRVAARELADEIGLHPFVVTKALQQIPYFSAERIAWFYRELSDLDVALKTSPVDPRVRFGFLLSKLATLGLPH